MRKYHKYKLLALFITALLIGYSNAPVFADFGSKSLTSGSFILKGMATAGGNTLTSASFKICSAISSEGPTSPLSSASNNLFPEWPSLCNSVQSTTLSPSIALSISSILAAIATNLGSITMSLSASIASGGHALQAAASLTMSLSASILQAITNTDALTLSLVPTMVQALTIATSSLTMSLTISILQDITISPSKTMSLVVGLISETQFLVLCTIGVGDCTAAFSVSMGLAPSITQDIVIGALNLSMSLVVSITSLFGHLFSEAFTVTMTLVPNIIQDIEANLSNLSESLSVVISAGGHALEAAFSLVMALGPSITQDIEANLSNLSENLIASISTGGHALEAAFALTMSLGLTMQTFMAHAYEAVFLISTFLNASITQNIEIATQFISESLLASLTSLQAHGFEEIIAVSENLVLTIEGAFVAGTRAAGGTIIFVTTTVQPSLQQLLPNLPLNILLEAAFFGVIIIMIILAIDYIRRKEDEDDDIKGKGK